MEKDKVYKFGRWIGSIAVTILLSCLVAIGIALTISIVRFLLF